MKPFNLEEYLSNPLKKIVTRDGRSVRIICIDRRGYTCPIVALVEEEDNKDTVCTFKKDGSWSISDIESKFDLFFESEKYEGWINLCRNKFNELCSSGHPYNSEEEARKVAMYLDNYITTIKIEWEE